MESQVTVDIYNDLARQFEKLNPSIKVQVENYPAQFDEKIMVQMAGGTAPDVFYVHYSFFPEYVKQGALLRLKPFITRDNYDLKAFFPPTVQQVTYKGESDYAIPRETSSLALFYNTDLFDQAGLAYPNETSTYESIAKISKPLTRDTSGDGVPDQFGLQAPTLWYLRINSVWAHGGDLLAPDYSQFTLNSPNAIQGLKWIADGILQQKTFTTVAANGFTYGKSAMMFGGFWNALPMINNKPQWGWDITHLPQGPAGRFTRTATGGNSIWAGCKNPDEAWLLLKFLNTKESQLALAKSGTIIPALRSAALAPEFLAGEPKNRRVFMDTIGPYGRIDQVTTMFNQTNTALDKALSAVWSGEKSVESAMTELKPVIDNILKDR
jgi:multiple sugar transport system substrate-binding protein